MSDYTAIQVVPNDPNKQAYYAVLSPDGETLGEFRTYYPGAFLLEFMKFIQPLEELHGSDADEYIGIMDVIIAEATKRRAACIDNCQVT